VLAALVGGQVAAGLLLGGALDLRTRSGLFILLVVGVALWICGGVLRGRVPLPTLRAFLWAALLAGLSLISAVHSPASAGALPTWAAAAAGLWLFPAETLLSEEGRLRVEKLLHVAAWLMVLLAVRQRLDGEASPSSTLTNPAAFAGAILLLLPTAARRGDWALSIGLVVCLWWTRSVGAWLGLSIALLLHRRVVGPVAFWAGVAAGFAVMVAAYANLHSPGVLHLLECWGEAWRLAWDAPWLGRGALPAVAHQYFLETAVERGWPYLFFWGAGLASLLGRSTPALRFGPVALIVYGLIDSPLNVPGVFWLFCFCAASAQPESEDAAAVRASRRLPLAAAVLVLAWLTAAWAHGWRSAS